MSTFGTIKHWVSTVAKSIFYDNSTSGLSASDVQGAIDELISGVNTHIDRVVEGQTLVIAVGRQLLVDGEIILEGNTEIDGTLGVL